MRDNSLTCRNERREVFPLPSEHAKKELHLVNLSVSSWQKEEVKGSILSYPQKVRRNTSDKTIKLTQHPVVSLSAV
ncbi:UNVERIFIED_CONTAM: hypothetical protein K2H54_030460 [Gekko kuhli]